MHTAKGSVMARSTENDNKLGGEKDFRLGSPPHIIISLTYCTDLALSEKNVEIRWAFHIH